MYAGSNTVPNNQSGGSHFPGINSTWPWEFPVSLNGEEKKDKVSFEGPIGSVFTKVLDSSEP